MASAKNGSSTRRSCLYANTSIKAVDAWQDAYDGQWIETAPPPPAGFVANWPARQQELVEKYRPDIVYLDDTGVPFGTAGLEAVAHHYRKSVEWHGRVDVVVTGKKLDAGHRRALIPVRVPPPGLWPPNGAMIARAALFGGGAVEVRQEADAAIFVAEVERWISSFRYCGWMEPDWSTDLRGRYAARNDELEQAALRA